jgi:hypothetical protein
MRFGLFMLAVGSLVAAAPSHSSSVALPVLVSNQDTVAGIETEDWDPHHAWPAPNFIRIRNASAQTVTLDSLRFPSDSMVYFGDARRLEIAFASRSPGAGTPVRRFAPGRLSKSAPITLAAGDSIDLGQFEIGMLFVAKTTASARRYSLGDSILAPITVFAGADSIDFILKAKVKDFTYGGSGIRVRAAGRRLTPMAAGRVTVDGRVAAPGSRPGLQILIR